MASERSGPQTVGAVLEPPGLFGRNYGRQTAIMTAVAHLARVRGVAGPAQGLLASFASRMANAACTSAACVNACR